MPLTTITEKDLHLPLTNRTLKKLLDKFTEYDQRLSAIANDVTVYDHADDAGSNSVIAAVDVDRVVQVSAKITETLAGTTTQPAFAVGYEGALTAFLNVTAGSANAVFFGGGTLPAGKALLITVTNGTGGSEAGKVQLAVSAQPAA